MLHIQVRCHAAAAFNKPSLEIANKCGVVNHKYESLVALCYQGEVHACGGAADIQQVPLDWNGSPWLSFTAAGPTLGAWERVQLGAALCIRDRPGGDHGSVRYAYVIIRSRKSESLVSVLHCASRPESCLGLRSCRIGLSAGLPADELLVVLRGSL